MSINYRSNIDRTSFANVSPMTAKCEEGIIELSRQVTSVVDQVFACGPIYEGWIGDDPAA
jgi:hypothetical protein